MLVDIPTYEASLRHLVAPVWHPSYSYQLYVVKVLYTEALVSDPERADLDKQKTWKMFFPIEDAP